MYLLVIFLLVLVAVAFQLKENEVNRLKARVAGLDHDLHIDYKRFTDIKKLLDKASRDVDIPGEAYYQWEAGELGGPCPVESGCMCGNTYPNHDEDCNIGKALELLKGY